MTKVNIHDMLSFRDLFYGKGYRVDFVITKNNIRKLISIQIDLLQLLIDPNDEKNK